MSMSNGRKDPTSTITLRAAYASQFRKRFFFIGSLIRQSIIENDCFGLRESPGIAFAQKVVISDSWKNGLEPIGRQAFRFRTNEEKMSGFLDWLSTVEEQALFQIIGGPIGELGANPIWQNLYIQAAYKKGISWARRNIKRDTDVLDSLGKTRRDVETSTEAVVEKLSSPVSLDRLKIAYSRAYTDLRGITAAMDAEISRILASGLALGENPRVIANDINDKVRGVGLHRAMLLARTETIRAHHLASIQEYRDYEIEGVKVLAEWTTARDSRVCQRCRDLDFNRTGKLWTLDEIEPLIPLHPLCRCAALPAVKPSGIDISAILMGKASSVDRHRVELSVRQAIIKSDKETIWKGLGQ